MKHATQQALDAIPVFLNEIRQLPGLKERKSGVFYRKSRAFLHFHEDGVELFADVRLEGPEFERFPATNRSQQKKLLQAIKQSIR